MRTRSAVGLVILLWASSIFGQIDSATPAAVVPPVVRFSGTLTATNATVGVTFALYKDQSGGAPLWLETQNITLDGNGRYTVNLGTNHAGGLPSELFAAGEARWLGVQPEGQPEQSRVLLVSVPYAMKAADADTLGGRPASSYVTADQLNLSALSSAAAAPAPGTSGTNKTESAGVTTPAGALVTPSPCAAVTSDGTALANYISLFTTPCNIEKSGLYQSPAGFLAVGTTAPVAPLDLEFPAQTGTSGSIYGEHLIASVNPATTSSANDYAFFGEASTTAGNTSNITGDLLGSGFIVQHNGTGTLTNGFGGNYTVINHSTGTITNAASFYGLVTNQSTGTITNGYGLQIPPPQNTGGGTFTNFYGVYVSNPTGATNSWGLYTLAAKNYVSGELGIGTNAPAHPLDVVGAGNFTGALTSSALTATGAVTGKTLVSTVATGTAPLTVASTTVVPNLNVSYLGGLASSAFPTLAAASNTFTGSITASSFTGSGAGLTNVDATELGGIAANEYARLDIPDTFGASSYLTLAGTETSYLVEATNTDTTTTSAGLRGYDDSALGYGVYGENDAAATGGTGVYGTSANGFGVQGVTSAAGTHGVYGVSASTNVDDAGVAGLDTGLNGNGLLGQCNNGPQCYGLWGQSDSGYGVVAYGVSAGGDFEGTTGPGLIGFTYGTGSTFGVEGIVEEDDAGNAGLYGIGVGASTVATTSAIPSDNYPQGVWGDTNSASGVGVFGSSDNGAGGQFVSSSTSGYYTLYVGAYNTVTTLAEFYNVINGDSCTIDSVADLSCTGTVTGTVAGVQMEHPLDPANKYLNLASVESPEMKNVLDGMVTLDGIGEAVVRLPEWFAVSNGNFRYQLTAVGAGFAPYIAEEIANGQFKIAGGLPGKKVSWQVTGVRQDVWAKAHPLQVETVKAAQDRGRYIHPELYGASASQRVLRGPKVNMAEQIVRTAPHPIKLPALKAKPLAPAPPPQFRPKMKNLQAPPATAPRGPQPTERPVQKASLIEPK